MNRGKRICRYLRDVRVAVARENDIEYSPAECHHEGDCAGTCPRCEQEVRYLERALDLRRRLGKAAAVAGIAAAAATMTSCISGGVTHNDSCASDSNSCTIKKLERTIDIIEGDDGTEDPRHSTVGNDEGFTTEAGYMADEPME